MRDIVSKNTKPNEESLIYQRRAPKSERQKLKDLSFKQKITYFNDYYRNISLVIIIVFIVIVYFLYTIFSPKQKNALSVAVINETINPDKKELLIHDFSNFINLNTKNERLTFDDSYYLNLSDSMSMTAPTQEKIAVLCYSNELDIIIADEEVFDFYASSGYLDNLAEQLPTDLYSYFSNSFYMATNDGESAEHSSAYGIYLDDSDIYSNLEGSDKRHVLGIVANSRHKDNTLQFLRYLYQLD